MGIRDNSAQGCLTYSCEKPASMNSAVTILKKPNTFRLDPYMAGPFAEGEYLITLKVTPALLKAIKPIWRSEFTLGQ
jgi:hypothetical protein